jgi:hypothetical protein
MQEGQSVEKVFAAWRVGAICALLLGASGCQRTPATVSGLVTLDGKVLSIASDSRGTIVFQPVGGQGTTATGLLDSSGHFKLATGASSDIAPGKYKVAVSVVQLVPRSEGAEQGAKIITPVKYASANTSGFNADVSPATNEFRFDMSSSADDLIPTTDAASSPAGSVSVEQPSAPKDK